MSTVYAISFTDNALPGKTTFTIAPGQHDGPDQLLVLPPQPTKAHTSLTLFGQGALRYGQMINENFVHLLENFASDIPPTLPTIGQVWFDSSSDTLKVFTTAENWTAAPGNVLSFNFGLLKVTLAPLKLYIQGDQTAEFGIGVNYAVGNDTAAPANNGTYTVISSTYNSGTNQTEITSSTSGTPVAQAVASGTVEVSQQPTSPIIGQIWFDYSTLPPVLKVWNGTQYIPIQTSVASADLNMNGFKIFDLADATYSVVGVTTGLNGVWQILGNQTNYFKVGDVIFVDNQNPDQGGNGSYTILTVAFSTPNTNITVTGTIPGGATATGVLANATAGLNVESANTLYLKLDASNAGPGGVAAAGLKGSLNMGNHKITNLTDPTAAQDAMTLLYANTNYVNVTGDTMTGNLVFTGAGVQVTLPNAPAIGTDATNKAYVDAAITAAVSPGGHTAAYTFTGLGSPVGVVTPTKAGDIYTDTAGLTLWITVNATNTGWRQVYPAVYS
jgi:hypothetical protein